MMQSSVDLSWWQVTDGVVSSIGQTMNSFREHTHTHTLESQDDYNHLAQVQAGKSHPSSVLCSMFTDICNPFLAWKPWLLGYPLQTANCCTVTVTSRCMTWMLESFLFFCSYMRATSMYPPRSVLFQCYIDYRNKHSGGTFVLLSPEMLP